MPAGLADPGGSRGLDECRKAWLPATSRTCGSPYEPSAVRLALAERLFVSEGTVKSRIRCLLAKIEAAAVLRLWRTPINTDSSDRRPVGRRGRRSSSIRETIAVMSVGRRPAAYLTTSLAIIVILVGGALLVHRKVADSSSPTSGRAPVGAAWHIYPDAFAGAAAEPSVIVPDGAGCFLAAGRDNVTGHGTSAAL